MFETDQNTKLLEFSHQSICTYSKHTKTVTGIKLNPNTRCFTSYNE